MMNDEPANREQPASASADTRPAPAPAEPTSLPAAPPTPAAGAGKGAGAEAPQAALTARRLGLWAAWLVAAALAVAAACTFIGLAELTWQVWLSRAARMVAAAAVGAGLAAAGMALQGLLRNPLADPYVLGISSGSGVGVLMGLALAGWYAWPEWASSPVLAFAGAVITCLAVYLVAQRHGRLEPYSLILAGVIVNSFNGAVMLTIYLYVDRYRIADFAYWAMGQLPDATDLHLLAVCGACVLAGWAALLLCGSALNVLGLGDEVAASSGVAVGRLRIGTFAASGLMTAAAVALAGPVAFLGLIVPHIVRMAAGPDHRLGLLASGLLGAIFLMAAETLCRAAGPLVGVSRIPVGILTALAGGPFFLWLLRRRFREERA